MRCSRPPQPATRPHRTLHCTLAPTQRVLETSLHGMRRSRVELAQTVAFPPSVLLPRSGPISPIRSVGSSPPPGAVSNPLPSCSDLLRDPVTSHPGSLYPCVAHGPANSNVAREPLPTARVAPDHRCTLCHSASISLRVASQLTSRVYVRLRPSICTDISMATLGRVRPPKGTDCRIGFRLRPSEENVLLTADIGMCPESHAEHLDASTSTALSWGIAVTDGHVSYSVSPSHLPYNGGVRDHQYTP